MDVQISFQTDDPDRDFALLLDLLRVIGKDRGDGKITVVESGAVWTISELPQDS